MNRLREITAIIVAYIIITAWIVTLVAGIIDRHYSPHPTVQLAMGAVCGWLFGRWFLKHGGQGDKDG